MGFSASAPTGQTGVGSATTQSANMPAPTGGKGGGFGTPTQTGFGMQQPQPQRYQPMGGNVYGYNMQRLAQRMDPSATLPQQPQVYTQPGFVDYGYNAPSYGGKGGGYGPQAPQFFGYNPFVQPMLQATAQPVTPTPTPAPAPASGGGDRYDDAALRQQITDLQNQIKNLTPATPSTSTPSTVAGLYEQYLGRAPETAEVAQYWNQRFGQTIDPEEVKEFVRAANRERAQTGRQPVPGFDVGEIDFGIAERRADVTPLTGAGSEEEARAQEARNQQSSGSPFLNAIQSAASSVSPPPPPPPPPPPAASSVTDLYQQFLGRAPESAESAQYWQQKFGSEISPQEAAEFKAEANKERAARGLAPMKKGGAVKKTKVQHKGMSNNLKKMLGK